MHKKKLYILFSILYLAGLIWLLLTYNHEKQTNMTVCFSKVLYGIPCPACGTTRAFMLVLGGRIKEAILFNPNIIFIIAFYLFYPIILLYDLIYSKKLLIKIYSKAIETLKYKAVYIPLIIFEVLIWAYNIYRHL